MRTSRLTESQIVAILREGEAGRGMRRGLPGRAQRVTEARP